MHAVSKYEVPSPVTINKTIQHPKYLHGINAALGTANHLQVF